VLQELSQGISLQDYESVVYQAW